MSRRADPLAPLRALPPRAAWAASAGDLRAPWLRATHADATAAAGAPPTLAAWARTAGCGRSTLGHWRRELPAIGALEVAPVGPPTRAGSRRSLAAARRASGETRRRKT